MQPIAGESTERLAEQRDGVELVGCKDESIIIAIGIKTTSSNHHLRFQGESLSIMDEDCIFLCPIDYDGNHPGKLRLEKHEIHISSCSVKGVGG